MTTLREIRNRLKSVGNIKQITKTMEMVAAARLRKAQDKAEQLRPYTNKIHQILESLAGIDVVHPFFIQREVKKTALVVIGADRGLCGAYNTQLLVASDKFLEKYNFENIELILFGRKAIEHYQKQPWKIGEKTAGWSAKQSYLDLKHLADKLMHGFITYDFDEIYLIYTQYITVMSRKVRLEKLLNVQKPEKTRVGIEYIFEPNPAEIYAELMPRYVATKLQSAFNEAYAAELAARVISMREATKNAEDMISSLTLTRNKVRQAGITKEMLEIIAGAAHE